MKLRNSHGKTVFKVAEPAGCLVLVLVVLFIGELLLMIVKKILCVI